MHVCVCVSVSSHITTCTVKLCDWLSKLYAAISITKQRVKCPIVMIIGEVQRFFLSVLIVLQTELVMETGSFGCAARRWIYCVDFSNSPHHIPTLLAFFFVSSSKSASVCVCVFSLTLASRCRCLAQLLLCEWAGMLSAGGAVWCGRRGRVVRGVGLLVACWKNRLKDTKLCVNFNLVFFETAHDDNGEICVAKCGENKVENNGIY